MGVGGGGIYFHYCLCPGKADKMSTIFHELIKLIIYDTDVPFVLKISF